MKILLTIILYLFFDLFLVYPQEDLKQLREEIRKMQERISNLESKKKTNKQTKTTDNSFNPAISVILNGKYSSFSLPKSSIYGFASGHESERGNQGLNVDHTEVGFASNIDDKFYGYLGFALVGAGHSHSSHSESLHKTAVDLEIGNKKNETKQNTNNNSQDSHAGHNHSIAMAASAHAAIELEEVYVKTLPGFLPNGFNLKVGKALWTLGYLNKNHLHSDTFIDRPLPYRFFLDNAFNDLGGEISYVLPLDFYVELGAGGFQGEDFPFGGNQNRKGLNAWSGFFKVGGDIGMSQSWQLGGTILSGKSNPKSELEKNAISILVDKNMNMKRKYTLPKVHNIRGVVSQNAVGKINGKYQPVGSLWLPTEATLLYGTRLGGRVSNHDTLYFAGDTQLAVVDLKYTYAPKGNSTESELTLQGEYFIRTEDGIYEDTTTNNGLVSFKSRSLGWYNQVSYKFLKNWKAALRYTVLIPPNVNQSFVSLATNEKNDNKTSYLLKDYKNSLTWIEHKNAFVKFEDGNLTKPFLVIPGSLVGTNLDSRGHNPKSYSINLSYMNSEYSKISIQYNQEELSAGNKDTQFMFQYTMSIGAHPAHYY